MNGSNKRGKVKGRLNVKRSMKMFSKAMKLMPGGVSSNARLWESAQFCPLYTPCTIFAKRAYASHIWDIDNNKYIDYRLGFGPVILGHSYPAITNAIRREEWKGTVYALDNELEVRVSEKIINMVPSAEMVRYSVSGTEATMHTIRLARAYTKKNVILKFEGHYHGSHDYLLYSTSPPYNTKARPYKQSMGIPGAIDEMVIVETFNNFESIEKTIKAHHRKIAAIIMEPIMGNASGIMPKEGYLKHIKELCDKYDVLLIFDEVKTGFRVSRGGAQELFGVTPHLTTMAKSMSNGFPISAIAGQEEIMKLFGPGNHAVTHGGTYASNPLSLTAAEATLNVLKNRSVYKKINRYGTTLMKGFSKILNDNNVPSLMLGHPSMFQFIVTNREHIYNYRELEPNDGGDLFSKIQYWLLTRGVMVDEDYQECWYMCLAHYEQKDASKTIDAFEVAVERAKSSHFKATRFSIPK